MDIGPTRETAAKLVPDTLQTLRVMRDERGEPFLSADLVEAGEEILRTWVMRTAGVGFKSHSGGSVMDSNSSERLQRIWQHWANELFRRCYVRPAKVVEWINPKLFGDEARQACDCDPKGAAGVLKRALTWWRQATRDVAKPEVMA